MTRNIVIFVTTFLIGAAVALLVRTARHDPYARPAHQVETMPTAMAAAAAPVAPAAEPHAGHTAAPPTAATAITNSICPICGMPVNPDLPTAEYAGHRIGFGCRTCPPKFAAAPELYGPAALRNEEAETP